MTLTYSLTNSDGGNFSLTVDQVKVAAALTGLAGTRTIGVRATDSNGWVLDKNFNITVTGATGPSALFAAAEKGVWLDPSDLSTMFTDTAGTVSVTTDGDLVARITDKSGNGYVFTQATSSKRPAYKTSGGLHWLQFDGVDDALVSTASVALASLTKLTVFTGARVTAASATKLLVETSANTGSNVGSFYLAMPDGATNRVEFARRGTESIASVDLDYTLTNPESVVVTVDFDIAGTTHATESPTTRLNGVQRAIAATAGGGNHTGTLADYAMYVGGRGGASLYFSGHLFGLVVRGALSTGSQTTDTESYLATKSGVTL